MPNRRKPKGGSRIPNIFIDVWTRYHQKSADETNRALEDRFAKGGRTAGERFADEVDRALSGKSPQLRRAAERIADSTAAVAAKNRELARSSRDVVASSQSVSDLQQRINKSYRDGKDLAAELARSHNLVAAARRDATSADRDFIQTTSDFESAARRRTAAIKEFERVQRDLENSARRRSSGGGRRGGGFGSAENALGGIFTSIPFVPGGKAGAFIGTGLVTGLGAVAEAVTTASQALWLLPAATAAAGAGFLTLKIGLSGFDKALKDMGDAKKFAQDLQGLAPNAQQAALEIQHLVGGLDSLKKLVQQSLFSGVAQQLHNLGNTFMPSLRQMFTGISGAFNQMFSGAVGQLTSAGTSAGIGNIIDNIVKAFQNLAPAMAPVVDAFTRIAQVGSTFLPGLGSGITNLAKSFDDFITKAQQTGQLQHWIQQGLDAAKALGHFLGELAHKFYDVFGNKSPQQFAQTLRGVVGTLTAIGEGIAGLANGVNAVVQDLQPVARALGGWPDLIRDVIAVWGLWKVAGLIGDLMNVAKILGVTLPEAAAVGAGRITAALATIAMPAWIATFLALWNLHGDAPGSTAGTANDKQIAGNRYAKDHGGKMPDGYQQWLQGHGPMPKELGPLYHPGEKPPQQGAGGPGGGWGPSSPGWNDAWWGKAPSSAGMAPWSPYDVPAVPGKKGRGGVGGDKAAIPYGPDYAAAPRPGEPEEVYSAEGAVMDAKHRLEQDRATLLNMQKDNNATAEEKQAQEDKLVKDQREIYEAQMRLTDAQQNATKKQLKGFKDADDEFNNIDQDFGLSKGLPGLVKNLVGMLGDLAAAPLMNQLNKIAQATGTDKNTFGVLGMRGQQNIAAGKSPLFGIAAGQPGGPAALSPDQAYAIYGAGAPGGVGSSGVSTMPITGPMPGAGPASIAPGVATAGYASGGGGIQLAGSHRPAGGGPGGTAGPAGVGGLNWDALAAKESSGNWATNTGNGYFGGLQFDQATWNAYKPPGAPNNPASASREQQIQAGQNAIGARGGPQSLWPQNYDQLYHSPHRPWGAQYDSYQPMGSWLGGGGNASPSGSDGGPGGGFMPGLGSGGFTQTGPYNGPDASGQFPQWVKDIGARFHLTPSTYGGHQTGNRNEPGFAPNPGGANRGIDWNGSPQDMESFADFARQHPGLFEQFIHNDPASGTKTGIAGGRLVGPGTDAPGYYGGDWAGHSDHDHTRFGQGFMFDDGPLQGPGAIPGTDMSTDASGAVVGYGGVPRPHQAQLADFTRPDPGAPGGVDPSAPTPALDAPRGGGWQPQGGGANGVGGLPEAALMTAASMFPGGGAAAQTAMQLINRTIGYGQQAAAIGVQGLMDTFKISSPDGDDGGKSDLSQGWFGRIAAGFAGARPALPNGAGNAPKAKKNAKDPTEDPAGPGGPGGDTTHNGYGGINNFGNGNIILGQPNSRPSMGQTSDALGTQQTAPGPVGGGFVM